MVVSVPPKIVVNGMVLTKKVDTSMVYVNELKKRIDGISMT